MHLNDLFQKASAFKFLSLEEGVFLYHHAPLADLMLLEARATSDDVGTGISTPSEEQRFGMDDVVAANAKRLQEALRSLEEFGKVARPEFGRGMEALRYRGYTLEQALMLGAPARQRLADARLYVLVTESQCWLSLPGTVTEVLREPPNRPKPNGQ